MRNQQKRSRRKERARETLHNGPLFNLITAREELLQRLLIELLMGSRALLAGSISQLRNAPSSNCSSSFLLVCGQKVLILQDSNLWQYLSHHKHWAPARLETSRSGALILPVPSTEVTKTKMFSASFQPALVVLESCSEFFLVGGNSERISTFRNSKSPTFDSTLRKRPLFLRNSKLPNFTKYQIFLLYKS